MKSFLKTFTQIRWSETTWGAGLVHCHLTFLIYSLTWVIQNKLWAFQTQNIKQLRTASFNKKLLVVITKSCTWHKIEALVAEYFMRQHIVSKQETNNTSTKAREKHTMIYRVSFSLDFHWQVLSKIFVFFSFPFCISWDGTF